MEKKNLIFGFVFILLITGLVFVFAIEPGLPTALNITQNVTPVYDEGNFTVNWTAATGANATAYNVTIWVNSSTDFVFWRVVLNDSEAGYSFNNWTEANYTFHVSAWNSTGQGDNSTNISIYVDRTAPVITLPVYTNATLKKNTETLTLNISVIDASSGETGSVCLIDVNGTNQTISVVSEWCNSSAINLTNLADGNHVINVWVNDTVGIFGLNNSYVANVDTNAPSVSLSLSSSSRTSLTISISGAEGTCTADRSGASISGSTLTETGLSCGNSYAYVVTCTDSAGNAGSSSSTSFSTSGCGSSPTSGTTLTKETHSWTKITPGVATIMKDFDKEIGLKQIQIEVNNEAQNVRIAVTKHEGKPAAVSVEKSGKTYKYLHINAENLEGKLEKVIIRMQVEKSWMVANGFEIDNMAMFKFNENSNKWDELDTAYVEADNDYYYYDAEVDSFSYFAISEKAVVDEDDGVGEDGEGEIEKKGLGWWWVAVIAGAMIILYLISANKKEISKLFKKQQNI